MSILAPLDGKIEEANRKIDEAINRIGQARIDYDNICGELDEYNANMNLLSGALMAIGFFAPAWEACVLLGKVADAVGHVSTAMNFNSDVRYAKETCRQIYERRWNEKDLNKAKYDYEDRVRHIRGITAQAVTRKKSQETYLTDWDNYLNSWLKYRHQLDQRYQKPVVKLRKFNAHKDVTHADMQRAANYFGHYGGLQS